MFRVDFENIHSVPPPWCGPKQHQKHEEALYKQSFLGSLISTPKLEPAIKDKKPGVLIKLIASEEARHWIFKLGISRTFVIENTDEFQGFTLHDILLFNKRSGVQVHRHRVHDINVVRQQVLDKLKHLKDVIQSHAASDFNSHEI